MSTQIIGLHIVASHILIQDIDLAICVHSSFIVPVMQGGHRYIAVYPVSFLEIGIFPEIIRKDRCIRIQVKGKLCIVEEGILRNIRII